MIISIFYDYLNRKEQDLLIFRLMTLVIVIVYEIRNISYINLYQEDLKDFNRKYTSVSGEIVKS